jgi:tetratricopeptide (TPR) repeat protein
MSALHIVLSRLSIVPRSGSQPRPRWRRVLVAVFLLICGLRPPASQAEELQPIESRAQAVLNVWRAGQDDLLQRLAAADAPDPWLVADALLALGEPRCAIAFAERVQGPESEFLSAYVARPEAAEPQAALRQALELGAPIREEAIAGEQRTLRRLPARYGTVLSVLRSRRQADLARASGDVPGAAALLTHAAWAAERLGWRRWAAGDLIFAGALTLTELRRPGRSLLLYEGALGLATKARSRVRVAAALNGIGMALGEQGQLGPAARAFRDAAAAFDQEGLSHLASAALSNAGVAYHRQGRYTSALRALDDAWEAAQRAERSGRGSAEAIWTLVWRAAVRRELQDFDRALADLDEALREVERQKATLPVAEVMDLAAYAHAQRVDVLLGANRLEEAAEASREALRIFAPGDLQGRAKAMGNQALVARARGNLVEAFQGQLSAWTELAAGSDPVPALLVETEVAETLFAAGLVDASITLHLDVLAQAAGLGLVDLASRQWASLVRCHRQQGALVAAVASAQRLADGIGGVLGGLGDEESALARGRFAAALHEGAWAAMRLGDSDSCVHLLEAGRAGALLEALGGRSRIASLVLPARIQEDLHQAQAVESAVRQELVAAYAGDDRSLRSQTFRALRQAQDDVAAVVSRAQRDEKARAGLAYPTLAERRDLQSGLAQGEVLVLFALPEFGSIETAFAVRIDSQRTEIVDLGPADRLRDVARNFAMDCADRLESEPNDEVRRLLVMPLRLREGVRRVLLSPDDELSYIPYIRLLEETEPSKAGGLKSAPEVWLIPSGTVLGELRRQEQKAAGRTRIPEVLAFADPDYSVGIGGVPVELLPADQRHTALPGTRVEARAATRRPYLGRDATEAKFRSRVDAVPANERLRAILLAAHGVIRTSSPLRSAIALTPEGDDDGELTALEITQLSIRADLVVLSACESGLGTHAPGEGILGLVRAFMFAGAPRVLASLWKVDDEATAVLMTHFFRRLEAKDAPAQALRAAQEHVRGAKPKWADPYYWAGWVLWGLPD